MLNNKYDPGFKKHVEWDIPLLEGYDYTFVDNVSKTPGSHTFNGIVNPGLCKQVLSWGATGILIYGWAFKSHLKCMRFFYGKIPVFFRGDSTLLDEDSSFKKKVRKIFLSWVYSKINTVFYVGQQNRQYFIRFGLKSHQLVLAPHAVDNSRFIKKENAGLLWRKKLNIPYDNTVFLYAGKLESKKNPTLLLQAFKEVQIDGAHLVIAGAGELKQELRSQFLKENNIHFLPFQNQSEMPNLYSLANIFVLPSKGPGETWGLGVNEAMACGNVILVSDKCGGANDLVKNNVNGFVFKSENLEDLKAKMRLLISNTQTLLSMSKQSLKMIDNFTFEKVCSVLEATVSKSVNIKI